MTKDTINKETIKEDLLKYVPKKQLPRVSKIIDKVLAGKLKEAVKAKCLDCQYYQEKEVRECNITTCPLWAFRTGTNPFRKKRNINPVWLQGGKKND